VIPPAAAVAGIEIDVLADVEGREADPEPELALELEAEEDADGGAEAEDIVCGI
jgi:hypothetical protein